MEFQALLNKLTEKHDLTEEEARFAIEQMMSGAVENEKMASFLTALKMKGESIDEMLAFAKVMREKCAKINIEFDDLVDTCGTGGDGQKTFNISTASAFVVAGAGVHVAKHGNRASSSKSGSADVLEALGIKIDRSGEEAEKQLKEIGISFLFAPIFHPAMKSVGPVRKMLGFKTVFNLLGPLTNPAGAKRQVIGVFSKPHAQKVAQVLYRLGCEKSLVVSSDTDEISISADTQVHEIGAAGVKDYVLKPEEFGIKRGSIEGLRADDSEESAKIIMEVLNGKSGAALDIVLLNAGAAIYASGKANSIKDGIEMAKKSVSSGAALEKLNKMKNYAV